MNRGSMSTTTPARALGGKAIRDRQRMSHLVAGLMVVVYVYMPGEPNPVLQAAVRWAVLPLLAASGVVMWQWPKIRRWLRSRNEKS
jgi:hypothetical protein